MSSQLSSGTHLHHGAVCRGAFDELTNQLWEVELISRCGFSRAQGPAGELQEGLGASWPDDKVAQGVLVVCRQSWDLPTACRHSSVECASGLLCPHRRCVVMGVERVEILLLPSFFFFQILSLGSLFIPSCASSPN